MPIDCPKGIDGTCVGCLELWEDNCCWFFPKMPLRDLLTNGERLEMLETKKPVSTPWDNRQQYQIKQLKGQINFLENKINKMYERRKREPSY